MDKNEFRRILKKVWYFIWEDNSIWSWIVNVILAFVLIKFLVYPGLGFLLSTSHPIVAVVSGSMEHDSGFDKWWPNAGGWYIENGISEEEFREFSLRNGFNKGDIMVLRGKKPQNIKIGDVVVFKSKRKDPIIHRIVKKWQEGNVWYFQTKGDNYRTNPDSIKSPDLDETRIHQDNVIGVATVKIPLLGWIKIIFVEIIQGIIKLVGG